MKTIGMGLSVTTNLIETCLCSPVVPRIIYSWLFRWFMIIVYTSYFAANGWGIKCASRNSGILVDSCFHPNFFYNRYCHSNPQHLFVAQNRNYYRKKAFICSQCSVGSLPKLSNMFATNHSVSQKESKWAKDSTSTVMYDQPLMIGRAKIFQMDSLLNASIDSGRLRILESVPIKLSISSTLKNLLKVNSRKTKKRVFLPSVFFETSKFKQIGLKGSNPPLLELSVSDLQKIVNEAIPGVHQFSLPISFKWIFQNVSDHWRELIPINTDNDINHILQRCHTNNGKLKKQQIMYSLNCNCAHYDQLRLTDFLNLSRPNDFSRSSLQNKISSFLHKNLEISLKLSISLDEKFWPQQYLEPLLEEVRSIGPSDSYTMLSFYHFTTIKNPKSLMKKIEYIWRTFNILGRVYIAAEGMNAQLAIPSNVFNPFKYSLHQILDFGKEIRLNIEKTIQKEDYWSATEGRKSNGHCLPPFKALHVRHRSQIVSDGLSDSLDLSNCGRFLSPEDWHQRLNNHENVIIDCRNWYESQIGSFDGAIPLNTTTFRDSFGSHGSLSHVLQRYPRNASLLMYCTGGIRCVKTAAYAIQKLGFSNVSSLAGGIVAYNNFVQASLQTNRDTPEASPEEAWKAYTEPVSSLNSFKSFLRNRNNRNFSKYKGANYVFDNRFSERLTEDILSKCSQCGDPCDRYRNCHNLHCHMRFLQCTSCDKKYSGCCSTICQLLHAKTIYADDERSAGEFNGAATCYNGSTEDSSFKKQNYDSILQVFGLQKTIMEADAVAYSSESVLQQKVLNTVEEATKELYPRAYPMMTGKLQGRFLAMLSKIMRPKAILDIGTFTGMSALCLAEGLSSSGILYTVEKNMKAAEIARSFFDKSPFFDQIKIRIQSAESFLLELHKIIRTKNENSLFHGPSPFDLIFLDADKNAYEKYAKLIFDESAPLLSPNGILLVDNVLWKNSIKKMIPEFHPPDQYRMISLSKAIEKFNKAIQIDPRLEQVILPIRDGLSIVRFKG